MNLLKRCFIQRFSLFDVLSYTLMNMLYMLGAFGWIGMLVWIAISVAISVACENHLDVRTLNGNSQVSQ